MAALALALQIEIFVAKIIPESDPLREPLVRPYNDALATVVARRARACARWTCSRP